MIDETEIEAMAEKAADAAYNPTLHGMTYEQGVRDAIDWVLGNTDDKPL